MKFFNILKHDLNKIMMNKGFIFAIFLTFLLAFSGEAYHDDVNGRSYTIFESLFAFSHDYINSNNSFSSFSVFQNGMTGYVPMFLPIIASFPFILSFSTERSSGYMRFSIIRTRKSNYYLSKFISSFLSGGTAVLFGMGLFGIIIYIIFPNISSFNENMDYLSVVMPNGEAIEIVKTLVSLFLYGGFSALPAFFLTSFTQNPYINMCLPFLFVYIWDTAVNKMLTNAFETGNVVIQEVLPACRPDSARRIVYISKVPLSIADRSVLLFNCFYMFLFLFGYIVVMNKRTDHGA